MPMPRANVQGLGAHVSSMASQARGFVFGRADRSSKQKNLKSEELLGGDDDASSSGGSDSESDNEGTESFLSKINAATAAKKPVASPSGGAKLSQPTSKVPTKDAPNKTSINKSPKSNAPASSQAKIIKSEPKSSSEDSSDEEPAKLAPAKKSVKGKEIAKVVRPEPASDTTSSDESSDESSEDEKLGAKVTTQATKNIAPTKVKKTESSSEDSSSEFDSEDENEKATAKATSKTKQPPAATKPVAKNAKKTKPAPSKSSDEDSESSEDEKDKAKAKVQPKTQAKSQPTKTAAPASSTSEESTSESESEEAPKSEKVVAPKTAANAVHKANGTRAKPSAPVDSDVEMADESFALVSANDANGEVADEFIREGFQLRKASDDVDAKEVLNMFKKAKKEGKQIWYFTTPASVPISVVEKMDFPMRKAQTGEAIVSHDGSDYGVALGASGQPSTFKILVPGKKGGKYGINRPVDHTMHLKRITQLAMADFTAKPKPEITAPRPPRQQPAVLKSRYTPIGVPTPILPPVPLSLKKSGDISMTDAPAASDEDTPSSSKASKKRKLTTEDVAKTPVSDKKSKKAKTAAAVPSSSQPTSKVTPVPIPIRAPSLSQPAAVTSTPASGKKSKANGKANGATATTPASKAKAASLARAQTPVPLPKLPGMVKK